MKHTCVCSALVLFLLFGTASASDNCPATVISSLPYVESFVDLCSVANNFDNTEGFCTGTTREVIYSFIPPTSGHYFIYFANLMYPADTLGVRVSIRHSGACPGNSLLNCIEFIVVKADGNWLAPLTAGVTYYLVIEEVTPFCGAMAFVLSGENTADCPTEFTHECFGEFVGDSLNDEFDCNGGCPPSGNVNDFRAQTISIGDSICAQSFNHPNSLGDPALDEDYFRFTLNTSRQIILSIDAEFDASVFLFNSTACNPGILFGMYSQANVPHSELTACMGPTTYYVRIKPTNQNGFGGILDREVLNYTFRVDTIACATCTTSPALTAPRHLQAQNTCGSGNNCAYLPSEDRVYQVYIPYESKWTFSLCDTSPSWDSRIYLSTGCCAGTVIAQNDDGCGEPIGLSSIKCLDLNQGVYYLTVEGNGGTCGVYSLKITECPSVTINEIMYDDTATTDIEWVELHNTTSNSVSIADWVLTDGSVWPPPSTEGALQIPTGTSIPAFGYIVLSKAALPGITSIICTEIDPQWALSNSGDNLALYDGNSASAKLIDGSLTIAYPDLSGSNAGISIEKCDESESWSATTVWQASTNSFAATGHFRFCTPGAQNSCAATTTCLPLDSLTLRLTCCENQFQLRYYTPGVPLYRIYYSTDMNAVFPVSFLPLVSGTNIPAGSYTTSFTGNAQSLRFIGVSDCTPVAASREPEIILSNTDIR